MLREKGWSLGCLEGELWARGVNIDEVSLEEIYNVLHYYRPEQAADALLINRGMVDRLG